MPQNFQHHRRLVREWIGLWVPAGTPKPVGSTRSAFAAFIQAETVKWASVMKTAGISIN